jgi:hypothetical protein
MTLIFPVYTSELKNQFMLISFQQVGLFDIRQEVIYALM